MNQNQTGSKPPSVEEPREEGLDETACYALLARWKARARELDARAEAAKQCTDYNVLACMSEGLWRAVAELEATLAGEAVPKPLTEWDAADSRCWAHFL